MSDRAASPLPSVDFPPAQSTTTSAPAAPMDDEYNPADPAPRDRDRSPSRRERSRSRERERGERRRSPSYEKEERDHDRDGRSRKDDRYESGDRHRESRHRSRSRSRSRSPARRSSYRHRSESPDRNRDRDARDRDYHPAASSYRSSHAQSSYAPPRSLGGPMNAPAEEAAAHAAVSVRENRVYVGNLSYDVKYRDLEKFMTDAGLGVAFTEILVTPQGMSKGCGIVELSSREDAQRAITEFTDKTLLGRAIFIREDREPEARFGAPPSAGRGAFAGGVGAAGGFAGGVMGGAGTGQIRQIYVGNLPYQANWQDLKDLFRPAGAIIRADIQMAPDGRPKGSGTVVYETSEDAQNAIAQFNGMEWFGRRLEVREDRYAAFGGGRGGMRGGFRGGMMGGGGMMRGGFMGGARGGFAGGFAGGMGGYGAAAGAMGGMGMGMGGYPVGPAAMGGAGGGYVARPGTESKQIIVNNLPWSTSNEDLVELFETTGDVVSAEILFDASGRSRGSGIVEFVAVDQATTAIAKFTGYVYGGRPLEIRYSPRNHVFSETAGRPGVGMDTA